jgi:molybdate transport system ATP-binding protein
MPEVGRPLVTLDGVDVRLCGATILSGISLEVRAGDGLAVVGPSGSGKSTLLRLVQGDVWPDPACTGRRLFHRDGESCESPIGSRDRFALVAPEAQDAYVRREWDLPVEAVIRSGFSDSVFPAEAATQAQAERIRDVAARLGIASLLGRSILGLSRGEARRALLARALARSPELLLLDEACDGLDAAARSAVLEIVERVLDDGTAVVMATHREGEIVRGIGRVVTMGGGRIVAEEERRERGEGFRRGRTRGRECDHERERDRRPPHPDPLPRLAPEERGMDHGGRPVFALSRVTVRVEGREVLRNVSFGLRAGERVAVLGPNGAGKSTFLRLLAGEEQPASGRIRRLGLGERAGALDLRGRIGEVSPELQARHRFDATGADVVASGFRGTIGLPEPPSPGERDRTSAALERLGLAYLSARHLLTLSYGELRKLLLARALAPEPKVLLLDEPLAGLDGASRDWMLDAIERACERGAALVTATHHEDEIPRGVGRVLRLEGGRLLA